jgi:hypothetical protein
MVFERRVPDQNSAVQAKGGNLVAERVLNPGRSQPNRGAQVLQRPAAWRWEGREVRANRELVLGLAL